MLETRPQDMLLGDNAFTEFKGAFTESYFLQELVGIGGIPAYYYSKDNSTLEIDFLVQYDGQVFPCEVKAEQNVKAKSLHAFVTNEFPELNLHALRFSMLPYVDQGWMENYPLAGFEGRFHPQGRKIERRVPAPEGLRFFIWAFWAGHR